MSGYDRPLTVERIAAVRDRDIDFGDIPELDDDFWRNAVLVEPDRTERVTLRVKRSVLAYFKAPGKGTRPGSTGYWKATSARGSSFDSRDPSPVGPAGAARRGPQPLHDAGGATASAGCDAPDWRSVGER